MSKIEPNFEKELAEIKEIVQKLSDPEITLSQSVKLYKEGQEKLKNASQTLEHAKLEIEEYDAKSNA
jgi:exodeoxyribonuclease VII small subunit